MRSLMTEYLKNLITAKMNSPGVTLNQKADALEKCDEDGIRKQICSIHYQKAVQRIRGFEQGLSCMGVWLDVHYTEPEHGKVQHVTGWDFT